MSPITQGLLLIVLCMVVLLIFMYLTVAATKDRWIAFVLTAIGAVMVGLALNVTSALSEICAQPVEKEKLVCR